MDEARMINDQMGHPRPGRHRGALSILDMFDRVIDSWMRLLALTVPEPMLDRAGFGLETLLFPSFLPFPIVPRGVMISRLRALNKSYNSGAEQSLHQGH